MNNVQVTSQRTEVNAYDLFSGGRAVSENLQIDRSQPAAKRDPATVAVDSLEGISIAAIDWSEYLRRRRANARSLGGRDSREPTCPVFPDLRQADRSDRRSRPPRERRLCNSARREAKINAFVGATSPGSFACLVRRIAAFGAEADPQRGRDRLRSPISPREPTWRFSSKRFRPRH